MWTWSSGLETERSFSNSAPKWRQALCDRMATEPELERARPAGANSERQRRGRSALKGENATTTCATWACR
eukprot:scaffold175045_cov35-Tisochrysis_lutea.AAC.2